MKVKHPPCHCRGQVTWGGPSSRCCHSLINSCDVISVGSVKYVLCARVFVQVLHTWVAIGVCVFAQVLHKYLYGRCLYKHYMSYRCMCVDGQGVQVLHE